MMVCYDGSMRKGYSFALLGIAAAIYFGWVYYSRWDDRRDFIRRMEESKAAQNRAFAEAYRGGRFNILEFYASPAVIRRGEKAQLCYSVISAESVRIEPPVKDVWPSRGRCVDITPVKDTIYKLIAKDSLGNKKTASITIRVLPQP